MILWFWVIPAFIVGYCIGLYVAQRLNMRTDDISDLGDW